jgi:hypothetical protein
MKSIALHGLSRFPTLLLLPLSSLTYFGSQEVFIPFVEQGFVQVSSIVNYAVRLIARRS